MGNAVSRVMDVIYAVVGSAVPLTADAIVETTNLPRATAYRLIAGMCDQQVLLREPKNAGFSPGPRLNDLSLRLMANGSFRAARHAVLQALVAQIGETCNFTTYHNGAVLYIDRVEAEWPLRLSLHPGSTTPLFCTSSGKLYLSLMSAAQRKRLLNAAPIPRYTDKTITDRAALERDLRAIRRSRVSTDDEGFLAGLISVAVPVYGLSKTVIGTVSVHALKARLNLPRALTFLPQLRRAASDLGSAYRRLSYAP